MHRAPFNAEELQRCRDYIPSKLFAVEVAVASTPMYCDRFRAVNLYSIKSDSQESCRLTIDYQIVYVKQVNMIVRGIVERSARSTWWRKMSCFFQMSFRDMGLNGLVVIIVGFSLHPHPVATSHSCPPLHSSTYSVSSYCNATRAY